MNGDERCSNCIYWLHGKCLMTGQMKRDSVCVCGQFKKREER